MLSDPLSDLVNLNHGEYSNYQFIKIWHGTKKLRAVKKDCLRLAPAPQPCFKWVNMIQYIGEPTRNVDFKVKVVD